MNRFHLESGVKIQMHEDMGQSLKTSFTKNREAQHEGGFHDPALIASMYSAGARPPSGTC